MANWFGDGEERRRFQVGDKTGRDAAPSDPIERQIESALCPGEFWNFQRELQKQISLPCEGFVIGESVRGSTVVMTSISSSSVKTVLIHLISRSVEGVLPLMAQSSTNSAFPTDARIRDLLVERIDKQHRSVGIVVDPIDST